MMNFSLFFPIFTYSKQSSIEILSKIFHKKTAIPYSYSFIVSIIVCLNIITPRIQLNSQVTLLWMCVCIWAFFGFCKIYSPTVQILFLIVKTLFNSKALRKHLWNIRYDIDICHCHSIVFISFQLNSSYEYENWLLVRVCC